MTDLPALGIILLTYGGTDARRRYARRTLETALGLIRYDGPIHVHIADDGSPEQHAERLADLARGSEGVTAVSVSNAERGGYGRNYNLATQVVHELCPVVLPLEDDWELQRDLDIAALLPAFTDGRVGCIRLGYVGWTQPLRGEFYEAPDARKYLILDPASPERHVFSGHPRLETRAWARAVGPWPEGLAPGETEFVVAGWPAARQHVAWPLDLVRTSGDMFGHIGTVRSTEDE